MIADSTFMDGTENNNKSGIDKLHAGNYFTWAYQMELLLRVAKVWGTISDETEDGKREYVQEDAVPDPDKNFKALLLISKAIMPNMMDKIMGKTRAVDAWKALQPKNSSAVAKALQHKIENARPAEYNSLTEYLEQQRKLWVELQYCPSGKTMLTDNMFVMTILDRIPKAYKTIKQMIEYDFNKNNTHDWESVKKSLEDASLSFERERNAQDATPTEALYSPTTQTRRTWPTRGQR
jgi:hypothetical protein